MKIFTLSLFFPWTKNVILLLLMHTLMFFMIIEKSNLRYIWWRGWCQQTDFIVFITYLVFQKFGAKLPKLWILIYSACESLPDLSVQQHPKPYTADTPAPTSHIPPSRIQQQPSHSHRLMAQSCRRRRLPESCLLLRNITCGAAVVGLRTRQSDDGGEPWRLRAISHPKLINKTEGAP